MQKCRRRTKNTIAKDYLDKRAETMFTTVFRSINNGKLKTEFRLDSFVQTALPSVFLQPGFKTKELLIYYLYIPLWKTDARTQGIVE